MSSRIEEFTYPDGTNVKVMTHEGFDLRDGVVTLISVGLGIFAGSASMPFFSSIVPEAFSHPVAKKAFVGTGAFVVGEVTEHSATRALQEACDFSDELMFKAKLHAEEQSKKSKKEESVEEKESEVKEGTPKKTPPKATNVRGAKK